MPALGKMKEILVPQNSLHSMFRNEGVPLLLWKLVAVIDNVPLRKPVRFILLPEPHFGNPDCSTRANKPLHPLSAEALNSAGRPSDERDKSPVQREGGLALKAGRPAFNPAGARFPPGAPQWEPGAGQGGGN